MTDLISCDEVRDKLPLHVGADLESDGHERVERHLQGCSSCRLEADRAIRGREALVNAFAERRAEAAAPELWGGLRVALRKEGLLGPRPEPSFVRRADEVRPPAPLPGLRLLRRAAPLAAAAACVLLAWGIFAKDTDPARPTPGQERFLSGVMTPVAAPSVAGSATVLPLRRVEAGETVLLDTIGIQPVQVGPGIRRLNPGGSSNQLAGYSGGELGKLR